jgi:hypothetical protein
MFPRVGVISKAHQPWLPPELEGQQPGSTHVQEGRVMTAGCAVPTPNTTLFDLGKGNDQRDTGCREPEPPLIESRTLYSRHTESTSFTLPSQLTPDWTHDLPGNIIPEAYVKLTRHFLSTASSVSTGDAGPRGVLKAVVLSTPYTTAVPT